jgi:hypothetical protein
MCDRVENKEGQFSKAGYPQRYPQEDKLQDQRFQVQLDQINAPIPVIQQLRTVLFPGWLTFNYLLLISPLGFTLFAIRAKATPTFVCNFLPIIPLIRIIIFATEQLRLKLGLVLGSLIVVTAR